MLDTNTISGFKIREDFLQFVWLHRLYKQTTLKTNKGSILEVIHPGELNTNAGADFFNARIRTGDLVLAGNIEVHVKTSEWLKHGHQHNRAYDTIILHVVFEHDTDIEQNENNRVEVLELKPLLSEHILEVYKHFQRSEKALPCAFAMTEVPETISFSWLNRMAVERLEHKMQDIETRFEQFNGDFLQTFFALLLRAFGFKVNSLPFELIASYLPLQVLLKHSNSNVQIEALLLGTAGMLEETFQDKYLRELQNEYSFLRDKYKLSQLSQEIFKYARMRPGNFPALRLAQLARLIYSQNNLFLQLEKLCDAKLLKKILDIELNDYWKHHYKPDGKAVEKHLALGKSSIESLMINAFAYFYFFYGKKLRKPEYQEHALSILEAVSFEKNQKTKKFELLCNGSRSGLESQGMIHLHDNYCIQKKCMNCAVATAVFKNRV
jgi:hypothetical protein